MSSTRERMERVRATLPPGTLLLVRSGAIYEFTDWDAVVAAGVLGRSPEWVFGAPRLVYRAQDHDIERLMSAGHAVAVAEA